MSPSRAPAVPVAIKHTGGARPGRIEMVILPPIETEGLASDDEIRRLSQRANAAVAEEVGLGCDGDGAARPGNVVSVTKLKGVS